MPAVVNFSIYAAGAVVINALLQVTIFVSAMAIDLRRVEVRPQSFSDLIVVYYTLLRAILTSQNHSQIESTASRASNCRRPLHRIAALTYRKASSFVSFVPTTLRLYSGRKRSNFSSLLLSPDYSSFRGLALVISN